MADLQITNLVKKFEGNTVVDKVSLEVKDGEFVVLLALSDAGKQPPCGALPEWKPPTVEIYW